MRLNLAKILAYEEMSLQGLIEKGWTFEFSHTWTVHGSCSHHLKRIRLSKAFVFANDINMVTEVILHEIAHALVSNKHGHDKVWRTMAKELGVKDPSPYTNSKAVKPPIKYIGKCPNGHISLNNTNRRRSCGRCSTVFNPIYLIRYERNPEWTDFKRQLEIESK